MIRTEASNKDFQLLVEELDADLAQRDGEEHAFYQLFNSIEALQNVVILYHDDIPVSCGAFKPLSSSTVEIKRMFTVPQKRGLGYASLILKELEEWAIALHYSTIVLETGKRQPEAIALYQKNGYTITANYGQYIGIENSVCFEKKTGAT
jgi:GNAT superfamily N-acetyltransferase